MAEKHNTPISHFGTPSVEGSSNARQNTVISRLKDNEQKFNACSLYLKGKIKNARDFQPDYINFIEKKSAYKSDFIIGMTLFTSSIFAIVYAIIPRVGTSRAALLILFSSVFAIFYFIEFATKKIRITRSKRYIETKELPRLKRENISHKTNMNIIKSEELKRKEQTLLPEQKQTTEDIEKMKHEIERERMEREAHQRQEQARQDFLNYKIEDDPSYFKETDRFEKSNRTMTSEDAYRVLDVKFGASKAEVQKGYREAVVQFHPDRVTHMGEEFKHLAEQRTKLLNQAYEFLIKSLID